jgi:opacity protein-like surface antigen
MKIMKTIKTLLAAALMMFSASAMAQATYEAADGTKYEFQKHAFLNLEAGAQYTLGEAKFSKLISPNIQIGLGYQFTPVFGARIQANAWQSKGGWNGFALRLVQSLTQMTIILSMLLLVLTLCST